MVAKRAFWKTRKIRDGVREMATDLMATSTTKLTLTLFHPIQFVWFVWFVWLASLCCPSLKMRSIAHEFRVRVLGICRRGTGRKLSRWGRSKEGWISPLRPCGRTGRLNCCHWGRAGGGQRRATLLVAHQARLIATKITYNPPKLQIILR